MSFSGDETSQRDPDDGKIVTSVLCRCGMVLGPSSAFVLAVA
jgi:hypothetical protein